MQNREKADVKKPRTITAWAVVNGFSGRLDAIHLNKDVALDRAKHFNGFAITNHAYTVVRLTGKVGKGRKR